MESLNLPLYPTVEPRFKTTSIPEQTTPTKEPDYTNPLATLENILNSILPQQTEETNVIRTKRLLGETAKSFTDEHIECIVAEFQFLINAWLDEFEQEVFNGMTLKEVLNER